MKIKSHLFTLFLIASFLCAPNAPAQNNNDQDPHYPFPISYLDLALQGQVVHIAYMDVQPTRPNGRTVVLLHGKNFSGVYWEKTIKVLVKNGYRVVVPDQIGLGQSTRPDVHYSFHMMAASVKRLLDGLKIEQVAVVGHSMGGMTAVRFALLYPSVTTCLVLEDPLGLEDYRLKIPFIEIEARHKNIMKLTEQTIRDTHKTYYVHWKQEYDKYVQIQAQVIPDVNYSRLAWVSALLDEMIYLQPVVYEFSAVPQPVLLVVGESDRTAPGKDLVSRETAQTMGLYPALAEKAAASFQHASVIKLPKVGHIPHLEAPAQFHLALLKFLKDQ